MLVAGLLSMRDAVATPLYVAWMALGGLGIGLGATVLRPPKDGRSLVGDAESRSSWGRYYGELILAGLLLAVLALAFTAAYQRHDGLGWRDLLLCLAAAIVGAAVSLLLFTNVDGDLRGMKTLVMSALSGVTLVKADDGLTLVWREMTRDVAANVHGAERAAAILQRTATVTIYAAALACALLGAMLGYLYVRFRLQLDLVRVDGQLRGLPAVQTLPWPELRAEYGERLETARVDDKLVDQLASKQDWADVEPEAALRAGAVLLAKAKPNEALRPLRAALDRAEVPNPMAFDLFAASLIDAHTEKGHRELTGDVALEVERRVAQMMTFWPQSFLVNVDAAYLYLYIPGRADMALHHALRALESRPLSAAANFNLACALAARLVPRLPQDSSTALPPELAEDLARLQVALGLYLDRKPGGREEFNEEGDFTPLRRRREFEDWLRQQGVPAVSGA